MSKSVADELPEIIENNMETEYIPISANEKRVNVSFDVWVK